MKQKLVNTRIYRACLGCPAPHSMEMPPAVAERLADLGSGVSCSTCPHKASNVEHQVWVDARFEAASIHTQEKLDEVLGIERAAPEPETPLTLLELMEA